jgi:hypothetical protein
MLSEETRKRRLLGFKVFLFRNEKLNGIKMKSNDVKAISTIPKISNEMSESYTDFLRILKKAGGEVRTTKKLWKNGNKPWLIKLGLALIVFPEPVISDVLGSLLIAAGTIQEGLCRRAMHLEDIPETFQRIIRDLREVNEKVIWGNY